MNVRENVKEGFVAADPGEEVSTRKKPRAAEILPPQPEPEPEPAAPELTEPYKEEWPIKVKLLHKPVRGNKGELLHELSFREPTGGDINRYGNPCHVDQNGDAIINERKMTIMMSALSGVLQPFLEGMDPRDWNSCAYRLRGFFLPELAAW